MAQTKINNLKSGFSLLEIMIALIIIGVIMSAAIPAFGRMTSKGRSSSTKSTLKVIDQAIQMYKAETGSYPNYLQDLNNRPQGINGWDGPYLPEKYTESVPQDAWNQDFVYEKKERGVKPPYDLYSLGDPDASEEQRITSE